MKTLGIEHVIVIDEAKKRILRAVLAYILTAPNNENADALDVAILDALRNLVKTVTP